MNPGLILNRALRGWRQIGVLAIGICMVTMFFALAPLYVRAMLGSGLRWELAQVSPAERYLTLISPTPFRPATWDLIGRQLGALNAGLTRITRSGTAFGGFTYLYGEPTHEFSPRAEFGHHAYAFSNLREIVHLSMGRWPERLAPPDSPERRAATEEERIARGLGMYSTGDVEAVISVEVARQTGYRVGTRFAVGERPEDRVVVHVVGIVEATDPNDPIWDGNRRALEGEFLPSGIGGRIANLAFFVTEGAYSDWIARATRSGSRDNNSYVWRIMLDGEALNADNVTEVGASLSALERQLEASYPGLFTLNPLLKLLNSYAGAVSRVEGPVILLAGAVLVLMLYHLVLSVSLVLEQQAGEWATLASRGAGIGQLLRLQGLSMALLCVIGFAAGPFLAALVLPVILPLIGLNAEGVPPMLIPPAAFALSAIAAVCAFLMLTLPALPAARRSLASFKQIVARPPQRPAWARYGLDATLIVVGTGFMVRLLFFVEGDLGNTLNLLLTDPAALIQILIDSANRTGGLADPLNLVGPALVLTGIALLWLRLFPGLMGLITALAGRSNGLTAPLSLWTVQRDPGRYAQLVLLLIGTLALGTAALALGATRDAGAWTAAQIATGGALRVMVDPAQSDPRVVDWAALPGVSGAAIVTRLDSQPQAGVIPVTAVGIDPASIGATFPAMRDVLAGTAPLVGAVPSLRSSFDRRRGFAETTVYPAVIGDRLAEAAGRALRGDRLPLQIGDVGTLEMTLAGGIQLAVDYEVVGVIRAFPSVDSGGHFLVMDSALLRDAISANLLAAAVAQVAPVYVWLDVPDREPPPALLDRLAALPGVEDVQAAWDRYNALLREPLPAAVAGMIYAGFWVSLLLSLLDFSFYLSVTARRRALGFAVLRALGWRADRLWLHIALEQSVLVLPALVVGVGLGAAMAYVILPFLALIGGAALTLPTPSLLILLAALLGGFGALTLGAAWWLRRLNINQTLRLGEE